MSYRNASLAALLLLVASGSAEAQIAGRNVLPSPRMLAPYGLERMWWIQATMNPRRDTVRYLTADEEMVFVQSTAGLVTAIDAERGRRMWAVQLGRVDQASFPVVSNNDYALVIVGVTLYGLDKQTGDIHWEIKLPMQPSTAPSTDKDHIYIGAIDGSLYCFNLQKVRDLYESNLLPQYSHETLAWRYKTGGEITSPAVSDGVRVSFASRDRSLYSVTAEQRDLIFQFETDSPIAAPLAHKDNWLLLASEDFNLYCVNQLNGSVRWEFISGRPVRTAPRIVDGRVFLMPDHGGMFCLNLDTGKQLWWRPKLTDYLATSPAYHFASDERDNIVILARETGTPVGVLPLRDFKVRLNNERTDRLIVATESGLVCAIRQQGREWPQYHLWPDRKPIVPLFAPPEAAGATPAAPEGEATPAAPPEGAEAAPKVDEANENP